MLSRCDEGGGACATLDVIEGVLGTYPASRRDIGSRGEEVGGAALARDPGSFAGRYLRAKARLGGGDTLGGLRDLRWLQMLRPQVFLYYSQA